MLITPYEDVPSLRLLLGAIATEPVLDVLLAAALTWAAHSSVAVVLLVMSFAAKGVVPPHAAFALVLGANLGTAINPLLEGAAGDDPVARRLPIGNLLNRLDRLRARRLPLLPWLGPSLVRARAGPCARAVADFHTGFNLVLAARLPAAARPVRRACCSGCCRRASSRPIPSRPLYLDDGRARDAGVALAGAAREALRMADVLETMLTGARTRWTAPTAGASPTPSAWTTCSTS